MDTTRCGYLIRIQCLQNLQSKEECIYKVLAVNSCSGGSSSIKYKIEPNSCCEKDHKLMQYKKFYLKISKIQFKRSQFYSNLRRFNSVTIHRRIMALISGSMKISTLLLKIQIDLIKCFVEYQQTLCVRVSEKSNTQYAFSDTNAVQFCSVVFSISK